MTSDRLHARRLGRVAAAGRRSGIAPGCGRGCAFGCLRAIVGLVVLAVFAWLALPALLTAYARWFIVETPLSTPADAAVTLAGGDGERLHAAIALYRRHAARGILIVGPDQPLLKVYTGEDSLTQAEAKRRIAVKRGIPDDSIFVRIGAGSTWDEAMSTRAVVEERGWRSVLIVTDPFHTRRARATFRHALRGLPVEIGVYHLPPERTQFHPERWWTRERDLMAVLTETIKTGFYAYRYRVWPWS